VPHTSIHHGFPTSSFQYRELIPLLADRYRVIAPDLPGFGFTEVPEQRHYKYSSDALAQTVLAFTDALGLRHYALYVFDYGAPTGFRLAMARPERVTAIVSQNGNGYEEGLGDAWAPIRRYWREPSPENRETVRKALSPEGLRWQYTAGVPNPDLIAPEGYTLDAAIIARPGNMDIQLDLFLDYANNVKLHPAFQAYFRKAKPPLLAIWGKHDPFFIPAGAEAYGRDNPNAIVQFSGYGTLRTENARRGDRPRHEAVPREEGFLGSKLPETCCFALTAEYARVFKRNFVTFVSFCLISPSSPRLSVPSLKRE
jgi:pimeloyl-ACP methyl ester carboxylesterase